MIELDEIGVAARVAQRTLLHADAVKSTDRQADAIKGIGQVLVSWIMLEIYRQGRYERGFDK